MGKRNRTTDEDKLMKKTRIMRKDYSKNKFLSKIKRVGSKLGDQTLYAILVLFYAMQSPKLPKSSRMIIIGVLGYFIFPIDLVPDFIPVVGFADDAALIFTAIGQLYKAIDFETKQKARERMQKWFGKSYNQELSIK